MAARWHGARNPVDEELVGRLEREMDVRLPRGYRDVLLRHDGQSVRPCHFRLADGQVRTVRFYSLWDEGFLRSVAENEHGQFDFLRNAGMVPFAHDPRAGVAIFFLDFREARGNPRVAYLDAGFDAKVVGDSFGDFMASLFDPD